MLKKKPKSLDSQFLVRVIRNEAGPEEKEFFFAWLSESDQNKEEFGNLVLLWDLADQSKVAALPDKEGQWDEIHQKIITASTQEELSSLLQQNHNINFKPIHNKYQPPHTKYYIWLFRVAAIVIISVGLTLLVRLNNANKQEPEINYFEQTNPTFYELVTQKGERKTFRLADGTIVHLNSDSKMIYSNFFSKFSREVEIKGEAYFNVVSEGEGDFKVFSGNMVAVVTGTEFNIKYRNNKVNVVVAKGSVKTYLKNFTNGIDLKRGEMISFTESNGFSKPVKVDLKHSLAWRQDKFSFSRTPLKEVMAEIERYYNIPVVFQNDSIMKKRFTGTFDTHSLEQIFSVISLTLDVKIGYKGNRVIIN